MPPFIYKAKKGPKEVVDGVIEAASQDEAVEKLAGLGLLPIRLEESTKGDAEVLAKRSQKAADRTPAPSATTATSVPRAKRPLFSRVRSQEITLFGRQLATLIKAGVPILQSLWIISEQSTNPRFKALLSQTHEEVKNGSPLSATLSQYPRYFSPMYIAMIRTGEDSGTLQEALLRISDYRQKQEEIFSHVRTAMAYPLLMLLTGIGTIVFMLTFVIPKLTKLFSTMGGNLPLPTKILMSISRIFQNPWFWIVFALALVGLVLVVKLRREKMKLLWSHVSLRLPVVRGFILKVELARFSRTLELLIKSGLPILRAIEITTPVLNNAVLRAQFVKTHDDLAGGGSLGESLKQSGRLPLFMTNLVFVGEQSGHLDEALGEIANYYERETSEAIKVMTALLEPLMILVMGLVVGFIVIAMLLPMFELNMMVK